MEAEYIFSKMREAKKEGISFEAFFSRLLIEESQLKFKLPTSQLEIH